MYKGIVYPIKDLSLYPVFSMSKLPQKHVANSWDMLEIKNVKF